MIRHVAQLVARAWTALRSAPRVTPPAAPAMLAHATHLRPTPISTRARGSARRVARSRRASARAAASAAPRPAIVVLPGLGNCTEDYDDFAAELESRGFHATVARVIRPDWLRNAAGLTDINYWRGTLEPRPTVDWYLGRIADAVAEAKAASGDDRVTLVAHSAGGWMARVYLNDYGVDDVRALVSLGSPLNAVPKGVPGVVDQTRGILTYVEANCATPAQLGIGHVPRRALARGPRERRGGGRRRGVPRGARVQASVRGRGGVGGRHHAGGDGASGGRR